MHLILWIVVLRPWFIPPLQLQESRLGLDQKFLTPICANDNFWYFWRNREDPFNPLP
jgi:hypothetical protein